MGLEHPIHILILLLVVLLVFGAKRLPEIGRSLGGGMRGFKDSIGGGADACGQPRSSRGRRSPCGPLRPRTRRDPLTRLAERAAEV